MSTRFVRSMGVPRFVIQSAAVMGRALIVSAGNRATVFSHHAKSALRMGRDSRGITSQPFPSRFCPSPAFTLGM